MDKQLFLQNLKNQFLDLDKEMDLDSNFRDCGSFDSLTGMTIIVMIKDEYGVDITESEFRSKKTVKELFDFVNENNK